MKQDRTPRPPAEALAGQARLAPTLQYLATFRPTHPPVTYPEPLPLTEAAVQAWVAAHPFVRAHLKPSVAGALAYLETFLNRKGVTS